MLDRLSQVLAIRCPICGKDVEASLRWFYRNSACTHCSGDMTLVIYRDLNAIAERFNPGDPNAWPKPVF